MTEASIHEGLTWGVFVFALITWVLLQFITAPYGRHMEDGWGPTVPNKVGWICMEIPSIIVFVAVFLLGENRLIVPWILLGLWQAHYVHRTFIFPLLTQSKGKQMPVLVMAMGGLFNGLNAYLNARWISHFGEYTLAWATDPRFVIGVLIFFVGMVINIHSDRLLINLREPGETGYKIPKGGAFRWVSAPNYMGECLEWIGWAIATWSLAGLSFAIYTMANLLPRALDNHEWYREKFEAYPEERRAIIPYVL